MPRSKALSHYPAKYGEIVEAAAVRGEETVVPLADAQHALKLRGHFYAYVGALRREARALKARSGLFSSGEQETLERAAQSEMVLVQVEVLPSGHAQVVFCNREASWQAQALAAATTREARSQPTAAPALDDIAQRLMQVQQEKDDGTTD